MHTVPNFTHLHFDKTSDEIGEIENHVLQKAHERKVISTDINAAFSAEASTGQRLADVIARIGSSWSFILGLLIFLVILVLP